MNETRGNNVYQFLVLIFLAVIAANTTYIVLFLLLKITPELDYFTVLLDSIL